VILTSSTTALLLPGHLQEDPAVSLLLQIGRQAVEAAALLVVVAGQVPAEQEDHQGVEALLLLLSFPGINLLVHLKPLFYLLHYLAVLL